MRRSAWLQRLPPSAAEQILGLARPLELKAGSLIHSKGEACTGLYGLEHGCVQVSTVSLNGDELIMTRLHAGSWFGEIAVIDGGPRTHDTYAVQPSRIAWLDQTAILQLTQRETQFFYWLGLLLCQHVRASFEAIDQFLLLSPRQRLAQRLLQLSQGENPERKSARLIQMNQEALAALVGLSRQSVNRTIRQWQQSGWLKVHYGAIELLKAQALAAELPAELQAPFLSRQE